MRVVNQIQSNLLGLQRDLHQNAISHRQMALAQSPALPILQSFLADCTNEYLRRLKWIEDYLQDPLRKRSIVDHLYKTGVTEGEITSLATALKTATITLQETPKGNYKEIVESCNVVLAQVDAPESLWPE